MIRARQAIILFATVGVAGGGGYWMGQGGVLAPELQVALGLTPPVAQIATRPVAAETTRTRMGYAPSAQETGPVLYWRDPDGLPAYSAVARRTTDGRAYVPVHDDVGGFPVVSEPSLADASVSEAVDAGHLPEASGGSEGKILYYRNPMGLPDTSPVPKKDSMGMDYIPVFEGAEKEDGIVTVSPGRLQRTGVRSVEVTRQAIGLPLRVPGVVKLDERRISVLTTRADAFVEEVADVTTGAPVRKGQPLMRLYSPEMASASAQFIVELRGGGAPQSGGARLRLQNLGVPEASIAEMEETLAVPGSMVWVAPQDGLILERMAVTGMMTKAGDVLFRLGDVSRVWVVADVPESEIASVRLGVAARVTLLGFPGKTFEGTVDLVYPEVSPETRSVKVRIELANPDGMAMPDMYAAVEMDTGSGASVVAVPNDSIIDSGTRQVVIADLGDGRFEPRPIKIGTRGEEMTEITEGVLEGERVVVGANFLIDAESNIRAALDALEPGPAPGDDEPVPTAEVRP